MEKNTGKLDGVEVVLRLTLRDRNVGFVREGGMVGASVLPIHCIPLQGVAMPRGLWGPEARLLPDGTFYKPRVFWKLLLWTLH